MEQMVVPARKATSKEFGTTKGFTYRTSHNIYGGMGWKWNQDAKCWTKTEDWDDEAHVIERVRAYGGIRNRGDFKATFEN